MADLMWSGPGRALQAHLDLFERVGNARTWIKANDGKPVPVPAIHPAVYQRSRLLTSLATQPMIMMDGQPIYDGLSTATERDDPRLESLNIARANGLLDTEYQILNEGQTVYVSHSVASIVEEAAGQASDEPLFPTDLPARTGLIVFEYPLLINDLHPETGEIVPGLQMPVRMIGWREVDAVHVAKPDGSGYNQVPGITYVLYVDEPSYKAIHIPAVRKLIDPDLPELRDSGSDILGSWATDVSGWAYGTSWRRAGDGKRTEFNNGEIHDNVAIMRRWLLAFFRFTWQRILVGQPARLGRPDRRRAERVFSRPFEDGYVKVMRLRRIVEAEARGEKIESDAAYVSDHQWIVRAHPRRQWYATLGPARNEDGSFNQDSHRLIWIEAHVAGNPLGPLVVGHEVTAVVR